MTNHPWQPNPQRVQSIRSWHVDQATANAKPVALFNVTITADRQLITKGLGIEPVHAVILLSELRDVIQRIESQLVCKVEPELQLVRSDRAAGQAKMGIKRQRVKAARLRLVAAESLCPFLR